MSEFLRVERAGAVATIWIDRQPKMNAMTVAMRNELPPIFGGLDADATVRVVVVRGAGGRAFSAGGDVAEFLTLAPADLELWGDTLTSAERCRKPVIAAIDAEAEAWGLITQAVPNDKLDEAVGALVADLAERAPLALRTLKMVLNRGAEAPLETALELERKAYAWLRSTDDYAEGVASFLEHRPAKYTGR